MDEEEVCRYSSNSKEHQNQNKEASSVSLVGVVFLLVDPEDLIGFLGLAHLDLCIFQVPLEQSLLFLQQIV